VNAGTDANVFIMIYGKSARTGIHQLNNRLKNDFERNSLSEFIVSQLQKILVRFITDMNLDYGY